MGLLPMNCMWRYRAGRNLNNHCISQTFISAKSSKILICKRKDRAKTSVFSSKKSAKKFRREGDAQKNAIALSENNHASGIVEDKSLSRDALVQENSGTSSDNLDLTDLSSFPSRNSVLLACTVTSGLIAAMGVTIRQMWHVELITGLVVLISSCRYLLLQTWPDFAESNEAANHQVLSTLQPLDYLLVAPLSGFSEELLFRGALLPVIGVNWKSALVVGIVFGVLHLGNGRKYSFAVWATFVGFAYGYATILSSSIIVPMASHAANNLVGGIIWRYTSKSSNKIRDS